MATDELDISCREIDEVFEQHHEVTLAEADAMIKHYQGCADCRARWGKELAEMEELIDAFLLHP